jgi:hypothetical protein
MADKIFCTICFCSGKIPKINELLLHGYKAGTKYILANAIFTIPFNYWYNFSGNTCKLIISLF